MVRDIKHRRLLNFHKIIQSWVGNEDKKVDIEFIKKIIKNKLSNLHG
jgi:hypothetical protein